MYVQRTIKFLLECFSFLQTIQKIDRAMQHRENTKQSNITVNTKISKSGSNICN